jgi:hypothetical protein
MHGFKQLRRRLGESPSSSITSRRSFQYVYKCTHMAGKVNGIFGHFDELKLRCAKNFLAAS